MPQLRHVVAGRRFFKGSFLGAALRLAVPVSLVPLRNAGCCPTFSGMFLFGETVASALCVLFLQFTKVLCFK